MSERWWIAFAGLSGAVAVAADAASQHLLAGDAHRLGLVAIGARYGLVHAVALLAVAGLARGAARVWLGVAAWCFVAASLLFCGGLYLLAAGIAPWIAPAVPVGGTLFILGWVALLVHALLPRRAQG